MNFIIILLNNNRLYQAKAERNQTVSFGSGKKDVVFVKNFDSSQISVKINFDSFSVNARKHYGIEQKNVPMDSFVTINRENNIFLYVTMAAAKAAEFRLPFNCCLSVGRSSNNDIVINFPFISSEQLKFRNEAGVLRIEDCGSRNGTYLNGKRIDIARMNSGDVLSIMSVNIILKNGSLQFENCGSRLQIHPIKTDTAFENKTHASVQTKRFVYRRSPRTREKLPDQDIILANAPTKAQKYEGSRGFLSSLAGSSAMLAGSLIMGVASPALLAARAASLVSPVASVTSGKRVSKKQKKKRKNTKRCVRKNTVLTLHRKRRELNQLRDSSERF